MRAAHSIEYWLLQVLFPENVTGNGFVRCRNSSGAALEIFVLSRFSAVASRLWYASGAIFIVWQISSLDS
jgi:hypothetical protein